MTSKKKKLNTVVQHRGNERTYEKNLNIIGSFMSFLPLYSVGNRIVWPIEWAHNFVLVLVTTSYPSAKQLESFPYNPILFENKAVVPN